MSEIKCIYCDSVIARKVRTKEHIFKKSFLENMGIKRGMIEYSQQQSIDDEWIGLSLRVGPESYSI